MLTPLVCRMNPRQVCGACLRRFMRTHAAHTRWPCVRCAEPDDNRSLYARLKEQKDTKQEEWEHKNSFKNQAWARLFTATPLACPADRQIG